VSEPPAAGADRTDTKYPEAAAESGDNPRRPFATQVSQDTLDRARATVRGVEQATGAAYSLTQLTEEALAAHCRHLETLYHNGEPWPVPRHLRPGRR
jgi:hypothetical protein